jgi:hypothetical protein
MISFVLFIVIGANIVTVPGYASFNNCMHAGAILNVRLRNDINLNGFDDGPHNAHDFFCMSTSENAYPDKNQ